MKPRNDEYYNMYDDDTPSPEEVARRAAGRIFDNAKVRLTETLQDMHAILEVHYAVCFREIVISYKDASNTFNSISQALRAATHDYKAAAYKYRQLIQEE